MLIDYTEILNVFKLAGLFNPVVVVVVVVVSSSSGSSRTYWRNVA